MTVGWGRWGSAFRFLLAAGLIHRVCKFQVGSLRVVLVRYAQDTIELDDDDDSEKDDQVAGALVFDRSFVSQEMQQEPRLHMQSVNERALTTYIPPNSKAGRKGQCSNSAAAGASTAPDRGSRREKADLGQIRASGPHRRKNLESWKKEGAKAEGGYAAAAAHPSEGSTAATAEPAEEAEAAMAAAAAAAKTSQGQGQGACKGGYGKRG